MGCSSSINPSKVIVPRGMPHPHVTTSSSPNQTNKSAQVKSFAEVSTQTDVIQVVDASIGPTKSEEKTNDINPKESSTIPKQETAQIQPLTDQNDTNNHQNSFLNSRLGANPQKEKVQWVVYELEAANFASIIQRELYSIPPTAIQIALDAMKKADELQNLTQDIWSLLEKGAEKDDVNCFILAYTHDSNFYEILNRKLAQQHVQNISGMDIENQLQSSLANMFQNLNFAVNAIQAVQAGQTVPVQGTDETDWAKLFLRPLYRLLLIPNPKIRFQGQTYRGMWISRDELQRYRDVKFVCYKAVTSTSAVRQVAQGFIDRIEISSPKMISVIFIYDLDAYSSLYSLKIRDFSRFPEEEEVLILPGILFAVVNVKFISQQATEVTLRSTFQDAQNMMMDGMRSLLSLV